MSVGNIASEYSELGRYADEDRCCREHDLCPHTLSPGKYTEHSKRISSLNSMFVLHSGECKRGLCNSQTFTRSHCDCDARFRRCLQGLNTGKWNCCHFDFLNWTDVFRRNKKRPTHWAPFFSMWYRWHVSKRGDHAPSIKGL